MFLCSIILVPFRSPTVSSSRSARVLVVSRVMTSQYVDPAQVQQRLSQAASIGQWIEKASAWVKNVWTLREYHVDSRRAIFSRPFIVMQDATYRASCVTG